MHTVLSVCEAAPRMATVARTRASRPATGARAAVAVAIATHENPGEQRADRQSTGRIGPAASTEQPGLLPMVIRAPLDGGRVRQKLASQCPADLGTAAYARRVAMSTAFCKATKRRAGACRVGWPSARDWASGWAAKPSPALSVARWRPAGAERQTAVREVCSGMSRVGIVAGMAAGVILIGLCGRHQMV